MTIRDPLATNAYRNALNNMPKTRFGALAALADRMAGDAFDRRDYGNFQNMSEDAMISIETAFFTALCEANGVDWKNLCEMA